MVKNLKNRFIFVAMAAVTLLLVVLLGAINIFNIIITNTQINKTMEFLAQRSVIPMDNSQSFNRFNSVPEAPKDFFGKPMDDDTQNSSRHFSVFLKGDNEIVYVNVNQISSVDEDEATAIAQEVLEKNSYKGYTKGFKYITAAVDTLNPTSYNQIMVFLDVSSQYQSIVAVLFLSVTLGILAWGLMLLLVIFLSDKAIKPIAENIQRQKMFITNAGHEIKTPLAIISANTEALELHQGQSKWSENIKNQTTRLSDLMQKLLFLSKADESRINGNEEKIDLKQIVFEIASSYDEVLKKDNKKINLNLFDATVFASRENLYQLFSVLIDNAVKYALSESEINVYLNQSDKVYFSVKNKCEQLPLVSPERLFDRFYRGDSARTQSSGGYGIGLSVARAIAEGCGGKIYARYYENNEIEFIVEI